MAAIRRTISSSSSCVSTGSSLEKTLFDAFGFSEFRAGQHDVIAAVSCGRDALVLWATGSGKSLCYQLPALHTSRTAIVVSPLISLMHDQVVKLNATVGEGQREIAVFLGSAQMDGGAEARALAGLYRFVYVSPEKIMQTGFLEQLSALHKSNGLSLVAIDEAHCISEWGHQFRSEYQKLGSIRKVLGDTVPIVALTATAIKAVRQDILTNLGLCDPIVSVNTVDRPNLSLSVTVNTSGGNGLHTTLKPVIEAIRTSPGSTIVYAPTIAKVQAITDVISQHLSTTSGNNPIQVLSYTGSMSPAARKDVHDRFLDNRCRVVCATVAFGMGIDKPDIRRIVHVGACKTFEEYYQQIGRAGRDGMPATCTMLCTDNDFANFRSPFYTKGLSDAARTVTLASLDKLRSFAQDSVSCRRRLVMQFFGESPQFERCGTCDNCKSHVIHKDDHTRDFTEDTLIILLAVQAGNGFLGKTALRKVISGSYKPINGSVNESMEFAMLKIESLRKEPRRTIEFYDCLMAPLVSGNYIRRTSKEYSTGSRTVVYDVYTVTELGNSVLTGSMAGRSPVVMLPVPPSLREQELKLARKKEEQLEQLKQAGVSIDVIPTSELTNMDGPVIRAHMQWIRTIASYRQRGDTARADANELLLSRIEAWRDATAQKMGMAPASVLADDKARQIAYSKPTQIDALRAIGVRIAGSETILELLSTWRDEFGYGVSVGSSQSGGEKHGRDDSADMPIVFPTPCGGKRWSMFVYRLKNNWEDSVKRFQAGEPYEAIAMKQSKKALSPATIVGHLLKGVECGLNVDLNRLARECATSGQPAPTLGMWQKLDEACVACGVDLLTTEKVVIKAILDPIVPHDMNKPPDEKSPEEKAVEAEMYSAMRWFMSITRAQIKVSSGSDGSEQASNKKLKIASQSFFDLT